MTNKIFLDSNILIYLYSSDTKEQSNIIHNFIQKHENILISTQVLFEFSYVSQRKLKRNNNEIEIALNECYEAFDIVLITYDLIIKALKISHDYKYSFPDSLIIATALDSQCNLLISEDMHKNQVINDSLKIINPFQINS